MARSCSSLPVWPRSVPSKSFPTFTTISCSAWWPSAASSCAIRANTADVAARPRLRPTTVPTGVVKPRTVANELRAFPHRTIAVVSVARHHSRGAMGKCPFLCADPLCQSGETVRFLASWRGREPPHGKQQGRAGAQIGEGEKKRG